MNVSRIIRKLRGSWNIMQGKALPCYAQAGEDQIVHYLLNTIGIINPTYLDIGTNFPVQGNNTYFFYERGFRGVCVEPDPDLFKLIQQARPKDKLINAGVGLSGAGEATLFVFPHPYTGWNTFSDVEAKLRESESGVKVRATKVLPMYPINKIMSENFAPHPNFISIDVEGLDLAILKSIDFVAFRPEVICVETIGFDMDGRGHKNTEIISFLESNNYFVYADTHINTIFCHRDSYKSKQ
jgi:FkbM family methyltransferase